MEFNTFVRKPFAVEAIEITEDNMAEIAPIIGTIRHKENGSPYIAVNRRLVPNLFRVYPGFWVTKMGEGENVRCYSKRVFEQQFVQTTPEINAWISYLNEGKASEEKVTSEIDNVEELFPEPASTITLDVVDPAEDAYVGT